MGVRVPFWDSCAEKPYKKAFLEKNAAGELVPIWDILMHSCLGIAYIKVFSGMAACSNLGHAEKACAQIGKIPDLFV
jgi:hypothetical protein